VLYDSSDDSRQLAIPEEDFNFVLKPQIQPSSTFHHPQPEAILELWQIFIDNVDPLTKIVHVPTLQSGIERAANNIDDIPRKFEPLIFAIYSAAVMSLTEDECKQRFGNDRKILLSRYISGTSAALTRANFMGSTSLVVLQAFVIHLISVRDMYQSRVVWTLTAVAIRIAKSMGLDRDGENLGLSPFETEIRRRIWWQLKIHDFRTAELVGMGKFQNLQSDAEHTKWPSNINDDQLYPNMASLATRAESKTLTDIVFVSLKCDLLRHTAEYVASLRQRGIKSNPWEPHPPEDGVIQMDESFNELEELLETKYLRYCDPSQPLHLMTMLMARCSMNIIRFMVHHPRRWLSRELASESEQEEAWNICIKLLEQQNMLQSNSQLRRFAWHAPYFQQWHAIIHVLDTLQSHPLNREAEKAWKHIGDIYENNPDLTLDMEKPIHVAVGNLCVKAYASREVIIQRGKGRRPSTPNFIVRLRQQLEALRARRQERSAKNSQSEDQLIRTQLDAPTSKLGPGSDNHKLSSNSDAMYTPQNLTRKSPLDLPSDGHVTSFDEDPFPLSYGFEDNPQVSAINAEDTLHDFIADIDDDLGVKNISWDQWDSWLTDSNAIRPLSARENPSDGPSLC
jgi:hypothetical protein